MGSRERGFTLIELLIVVAILGIIAAIAIPNLILAIQRAKQKQAMSEIRSLSTAVNSYATDTSHFALGSGSYQNVDAVTEVVQLAPDYLKRVPSMDPWNTTYQYAADDKGADFSVRSLGKGGVADSPDFPDILTLPPVGTHCFENDIVWSNSGFVLSPEGKQKRCS
jgi:general secretion pathway protein G